ncbi:unnamed protein product [Penicillium manginii]
MESFSVPVPMAAAQKRTEASQVLVLSAKNKSSLEKKIDEIQQFLIQSPGKVNDIVYTLGLRREHLSHRAFAIVEQNGTISAFEKTRDSPSCSIIYIFTGQGAQWPGMGKELFFMSDYFRERIRVLDETLRNVKDSPCWTIEGEMLKDAESSRIAEPEVAQPLCTAVQIALVDMLRQYGIQPSSVIGHSSGEIAAAYASGAMTVEAAITVAYFRGLSIRHRLDGPVGAMAVVGLSREKASSYLLDGVTVACDNSPNNVTLSGDAPILAMVLKSILADNSNTFCRRLDVSVAYHSRTKISDPQELDAAYWSKNLLSPVIFKRAVENVLAVIGQNKLFIEIGPHSTLSSPLRDILQSRNALKTSVYIPTLIREKPQWRALCATAGRLYVNGAPIQLSKINGVTGQVLTSLPSYPWLHTESLWSQSRLVERWTKNQEPRHELLGSRGLESNDVEPSWRNILHLAHVPWLWDHVIGKDVIFPCAAYVAMIGEAIRQATGSRDFTIRRLLMTAPLVLDESEATELHTSLRSVKLTDLADSTWYEFTITAFRNQSWHKYCAGQAKAGTEKTHLLSPVIPYARQISAQAWYRAVEKREMKFGPRFRRLESISTDPSHRQAAACIRDQDELYQTCRYALHPTIIDQALQLMALASTHGVFRTLAKLCMPTGIESIYINHARGAMSLAASCEVLGASTIGNARILAGGKPALVMEGGLLFAVDDIEHAETSDARIGRLEWKPHIDFLPACGEPSACQLSEGSRRLLQHTMRLLIQETAENMQSLDTESLNLQNYKAWIISQAERPKSHQSVNKASLCKENICSNPTSLAQQLEAVIKQVEQQIPELAPLMAMAKTISAHCREMFEGKVTPEELLPEKGVIDGLYRYVSTRSGSSDIFSLLGHANPGLRALEIGSGNGFFTTMALRDLTTTDGTPMYSQYMVTDKSTDSLSQAKEKFKAAQGLEYSLLDIFQDPFTQGLLPQSYDIVILSHKLFADDDISSAMGNIVSLLAPGGRLLYHRVNHTIPLVPYIIGIHPGWLRGNEKDTQSEISDRRWESEFKSAGLSGGDSDAKIQELDNFGIRVVSRPVATATPKGTITLLYLSTISEWGLELARCFAKTGYAVQWCPFGQVIPSGTDVVSLIDLEGPFFENLSPEHFSQFKSHLDQIADSRTVWVTQMSQITCDNPGYGMILGMARSIRQELGREFATIEVDRYDVGSAKEIVRIMGMCQEQTDRTGQDPDYEYILKDGTIHIGRVHWTTGDHQSAASGRNTSPGKELNIATYGLLSSLSWTDQAPSQLKDDEVELDMRYIGLNFRDMMVAMGLFGDKTELGLEGSAIVRRVGPLVKHVRKGDGVMVVGQGLFCSRKVISGDNCFLIFPNLSLEDAATVVCAYGTAIHSLLEVGNLRKGQTVLIHSACGGVGLAAIQVCQAIGAEIYVTVGNSDKVQYLIDAFHIPKAHIFDSRSPSFFQGVMDQTGQRGVDIVLNSLSGELLHLSWQCVAKFGKMIELGKRDILGYGQLNMNLFSGNRSFIGVDVKHLVEADSKRFCEIMLQCRDLFAQGKARAIQPVAVFDAINIEKAFSHMQTGQHIGKIVVKMPDNPSDLPISRTHHSFHLPSNASFLLVGGLGGLGRAVATWMVEQGARHFVFLSRSAGLTLEDKAFINELESQHCTATAIAGDVATLRDVQRAVSACNNHIEGVIQMSMVMKNQLLINMTHEDWLCALAPKVRGTWNLHNALQNQKIGFFVAFSSISGLCGNTGQANYATANSFLDAFVTYRRGLGLAASVIDIGLMEDIGYASENKPKLLQQAKAASMKTVAECELLHALELAICADQQRNELCQIVVGLGTTKPLSTPGVVPFWARDARFSLWANIQSPSESCPTSSEQDGLRDLIDSIKINSQMLNDPAIRSQIVTMISRQVGSHLTNTDDMDDVEISHIAIESLVMIEIRIWARRHLALELSMAEIAAVRTIGGLGEATLKALRLKYQTQENSDWGITGVPESHN